MKTSICRYSAYTPKPVQNQPNFTAQSRTLFPRPPETSPVASPRSAENLGPDRVRSPVRPPGLPQYFQCNCHRYLDAFSNHRKPKCARKPGRTAAKKRFWAGGVFQRSGFKTVLRHRAPAKSSERENLRGESPGGVPSLPESHPTYPSGPHLPKQGRWRRFLPTEDWCGADVRIMPQYVNYAKGTDARLRSVTVVCILLLCDGR